MKCSYCGADLAEGRRFCDYCGTEQEGRQDALLWTEEMLDRTAPPAPPVAPAPKPEGGQARPAAPRIQLPTGRGLAKMFFLGILTLGIYPTVIWSRIVTELNLAASRYDGKRTMPYFAMCILAPITLGIYLPVWFHGFCSRVGEELKRRNIDYQFGAKTFWLWNVLGSLILVGPFIFVHKLMKAMNRINGDFNRRG